MRVCLECMKLMKDFIDYSPEGRLRKDEICLICESEEEIIFDINEDEIYVCSVFKELALIKRENQEKKYDTLKTG